MKESTGRYNIRYLGFEGLAGGGRCLHYSITSPGEAPRRVRMEIPPEAFGGDRRVAFQESTTICYEKLRSEIERQVEMQSPMHFRITAADIEEFRPRRRAAAKKA